MKISLTKLIFLVFTFFVLPNYSVAQLDSVEQAYFKSIEKFQEQDSFNAYFNEINKLRTYYKNYFKAFKNKSLGRQERIKHVLFLFEKFIVYREPNSIKENHIVRKYYYTLLYWTKNGAKNYRKALSIGLKATNYIDDLVLLDTFAYNIERQIGIIYNIQGDYSRALFYLEKCIAPIKANNNYKRLSYLYSNLGDTYKGLRNYDRAKEYYNLGIKISREINCFDCLLANKPKIRDIAYLQREYDLFVELAKEDRKLLESYKTTSKIKQRLIELDDVLGNYYYNQNQYAKALPLFLNIKSYKQENNSSKINRDLAKINLKIAQCYNSLGKADEFRREIKNTNTFLLQGFNGILPPDSILYAENSFIDIFEVSSYFFELEFANYHEPKLLDTSLIFLEKAIKIAELIDQKIIYSDSKSLFANQSKKCVDKAIEIAFQKHEMFGSNAKDLQRVRNLFNASKDQILKDKIDLQEKIKKLDSENKNIVDSLIFIIVSELSNTHSDNKNIIACQDKIEKITGFNLNKKKQVELKNDYLEYVITNEFVFLLASISSNVQFIKLGTAKELETLINTYKQKIKPENDEQKTKIILSKLANYLYPNQISLPYSFTVIPDAKLTTIPFDILIKNDEYIIEKHLTSVSTHYITKPPSISQDPIKMLCINPEYTSEMQTSRQGSDRSALYPLPFAIKEANNLKSIFSSSFEVEKIGTPLDISKKLENANVFHFTGHAKVNKDSAYLVLIDGKGINKWTYKQIYHNNFNLSLVTLSACETGLGKIQYGDGLNSVARSFLGAGSAAVVYSLWTVNDMSTSIIMKKFYTEINKGISINEAIRQAKLDYLQNAIPERRHPYYWGGFVPAGDMSPLTSNTNYPLHFNYILILGILAFVIIYFINTQN